MAEEQIAPTEEIQATPKEEEIASPVEEKKEKPWFKLLLFSILGIVLAAGLVFAGYKFGQRASPELAEKLTPTPSPEATPSAGTYRIAGIDLTIDKALRVERRADDKDLLVLTVTFMANEECSLTGGAVCGYDTRWFRLVDDEGFVQDQLFAYPTIKYLTTNPISQRILKLGEKDKGDVFFEIDKDKNKFFLTYFSAGEMTEKIALEPELFDPTADWKTYTNTKYKFSFKFPPDWIDAGYVEDDFRAFKQVASKNLEEKGVIPYDYILVSAGLLKKVNQEGFWNKQADEAYFNYLYSQKIGEKRKGDPRYTITKLEELLINGAKAVKQAEEVAPEAETEYFYTVSVYILKNGQVFEFSDRFPDQDTWIKTKQTFNLMLSTFKFLE